MRTLLSLVSFQVVLGGIILALIGQSQIGNQVLSPADLSIGWVSGQHGDLQREPTNRLLTDPVLQFEPWTELNRSTIRRGALPVWNDNVGFGAPHLGNGQSAVFDPFSVVTYLLPYPSSLAWRAGLRVWIAGTGMYLLCATWGLGFPGRWFGGLCFPLSGFLSFWLLYPMSGVAAWLPWLLIATYQLVRKVSPGSVARLALLVSFSCFGGHIQTTAHVLLLTFLYQICLNAPMIRMGECRRRLLAINLGWLGSMGLGIGLAAVAIVPLGSYLASSPVWSDRIVEHSLDSASSDPRLGELLTLFRPYCFGSQQSGHPNLAKAFDVDNVNEAASGFAGLPAILWLAPLGWLLGRDSDRSGLPIRWFLGASLVIGLFGGFQLPPFPAILQYIPVLNVTDHRRLSLWVAFALIGLGAFGLDRFRDWRPGRLWKTWILGWILGALGLGVIGGIIPALVPKAQEKAAAHYRSIAESSVDMDESDVHYLVNRQVRNLSNFYPRYLGFTAILLLLCATIGGSVRWVPQHATLQLQVALIIITVGDLFYHAGSIQPGIDASEFRPEGVLVKYLRRVAPPPARILPIGTAFPPNSLMRYGLRDLRTYDSVESEAVLRYLDPLFKSDNRHRKTEGRSSRREIDWQRVAQERNLLVSSDVRLVLGRSPPPPGIADQVDLIGTTWIARIRSVSTLGPLAGNRVSLRRDSFLQQYERSETQRATQALRIGALVSMFAFGLLNCLPLIQKHGKRNLTSLAETASSR